MLAIDNAHPYERPQKEIAERGKVEEALHLSERRFRALVQNSSDVTSVFDAGGKVLYQSQSVVRVLSGKAEDRVGEIIFDPRLIHPDDLDRTREFFRESRANPVGNVKAEFRLRGADGSWRHIEARGKNLLDDPAVGSIAANDRDKSERTRN